MTLVNKFPTVNFIWANIFFKMTIFPVSYIFRFINNGILLWFNMLSFATLC